MTTIAILGGGFCGTMAAVNLARLAGGTRRIVLVNAAHPTGRGVAYGTPRPEHVLNVLARNMSARPDVPSQFVDYLRLRPEYAHQSVTELGEIFAPRRVYGDYVQGLLNEQTAIETIEDEAIDIVPGDGDVSITLKKHAAISADAVILATGNLAPLDVPGSEAVRDHPAYLGNPWGDWHCKLPDAADGVLLVGTSLTMVDAVLTMRSLGWKGSVTAVSRNGLLPLSHFPPPRDAGIDLGEPWAMGLAAVAARVEAECARLRREGLNPAAVVDKLRPVTQRVWQSFSVEDRKTFNRDYRTRWGVARHRIAPEVAAEIDTAMADGTLRVMAGEIRRLTAQGPMIQATINVRGETREIVAGLVMNCTGPRERFSDAPEPLFRNLFQRGLVMADELDLGLTVAPNYAVIGQDGSPSKSVYAFGPLLRGSLWETTAVPELRDQALQVAKAVLR